MFILASKPTVLWPVVYQTPADGGTFQEHQFNGRFNLPADQAEVDQLFQRLDEDRRNMLTRMLQKTVEQADADPAAVDKQIIEKYFVGWPDGEVNDSAGNVVLCTAETRAALLALPGMRVAVVQAFMRTLNGAAEAKNSKPLPKNG